MTLQVEVGQLWRRKSDDALVAIRELNGSSHSFIRVQNMRTGRHFEATASGIRSKYVFAGLDASYGDKEGQS